MGIGKIAGYGAVVAVLGWMAGTAVAAEAAALARLESREFPVRVESRDAVQGMALLKLAERVVILTGERMGWPGAREVRMVLRVARPAPPPAFDVPPEHFPRRLESGRQTRLLVELDAGWPAHREAVVRTLVMGLCQAMVWGGEGRPVLGELPNPPLWLSEGLVQALMNGEANAGDELAWIQQQSPVHRGGLRAEQWRQVVHRAKVRGKVPTLEEIQGWKGLGETALERQWRQAFCYWLFAYATESASDREALVGWWKRQQMIVPEPYWSGEPGSRAWWARTVEQSEQARMFYWNWDQTISHLREALHFEAAVEGRPEPVLFSVVSLPAERVRWRNPEILNGVRLRIMEIGSRGHPSLQSVAEGYLQALKEWEAGQQEKYLRRILGLLEEQKRLDAFRRAVEDRLIWVEVNREFSGRGPVLADFAEALRAVEAEEQQLRKNPSGGGP